MRRLSPDISFLKNPALHCAVADFTDGAADFYPIFSQSDVRSFQTGMHPKRHLGRVMDRFSFLKWTTCLSVLAAGTLMATSTLGSHNQGVAGPGKIDVAPTTVGESATSQPVTFASSAGTAFSIAPGLLVTDAHVTLQCTTDRRPIQVAGYQGPWRVMREDKDLDLVLLRGPDDPPIPPVALSAASHIQRDTETLLLGYPVDAAAYDVARSVLGAVQHAIIIIHQPGTGQAESFRAMDRTGHLIDPTWQDGAAFFGQSQSQRMRWAFEISATIGHGASGGPVVDRAGNVIGVIVADGTNQGLISATTISDLVDFLGSAGIVPRFAPPPNEADVDWHKAFHRAAPSVVRIGC
ncbi:MAG: hypothetical protein B7Z80_03010 [Rhodospirillales bacterium 20-64-7]|nr:MAG: hypothetical protein B7Z80_03010 [Rhodospirillales bacterium 20-64-7]